MIETLPLYYDGKTQAAPAGVTHLTLNAPATGQPYAQVPLCGADTVDQVVRSAQAAFPGWRDTPVVERARVLFRYRQILEGEADAVARLVSHDHGKTLADAKGEVQRGIEVVEFACGMPTLLQGETVDEAALARDLTERDRRDSARAHSPLRPAPDALVLDTTRLRLDAVVDAMEAAVRRARAPTRA